jgi:Na+/melibiose symporter-like transporter
MRAADGDRERTAERLRQAVEEGRLTLDEVDQRLIAVYAAKTFGDLDRIVADLPLPAAAERSQVVPATPPARVPASRHEENPKLPTWLSVSWRAWLVAVAINLVIWFLVSVTSGGLVYFWPMWVAGPWAAANIGLMILFPPSRRS